MHPTIQPRQRVLAGTAILLAIALFCLGNFNNPPNGYTGAPGDSLCTECHSLGGGMQNGGIVVNGFPGMIVANQTYSLSVSVANPNGIAEFAGFQMVILDASNNNAGTMSNAGPASVITNAGGRSYHEHNPAQMFDGSNVETWTVDWTAPVGSGLLTYYAAGNIANGNGEDSGDLIVTTSGSGDLMTPLMVAITQVQHVSCFGFMDGSMTAEATFGDPGYTYNWSNGQNGATIPDLGPGTYTVTVTDNQGATATASADVSEPPLFEIVSQIVDHVACNGGNDGQIILTLDGGVPPYTGAQGDIYTLSNLQAGDYNVMITDANGCLISEDYTITEPEAIFIEITVIVEPNCFGEATGLITVEPSGGQGDFTFAWNNGETGSTIQNLEGGVYSVTVTDDNGCTSAETISLDEPDLLFLELIVLEDVSCPGAQDGQIIVEGTGGTGELNYQWSNGAQGEVLTDLGSGTYTVTVTDDNGCTDASTYMITEPAQVTADISGTTMLTCFGDTDGMLTIDPVGGTMPYSYIWSNGETTQTITGLGAGTYTVTVTDANGCMLTESTEITQPPQLLPNATSTNETGPGAMDGTATANPSGGTGGYTYAWSNGETTQMITGLSVGVYNVTVTDANDCTASQSVNVSGVNCTLSITIMVSDPLCFGDASGTAQVMPAGAMGDVDILWSNGDTMALVVGLAAGSYGVTVTDAEGCIATGTAAIGQPPVLTGACTVTHESAKGANDGSISCTTGGGTIPYGYLWSTGDTTAVITGLAPGTYFLTITDANGCIRLDTATVNSFACAMSLSVTTVSNECFGDSTGSATISVSGGTAPYTYVWSHGATGQMVSGLPAGVYEVTVTDADNCESELTLMINQPDAISVVVDSVFHVSGGGGNGAIFISVIGGTPPYAFIWTRNGGLVGTSEDITGLVTGDYELEVTDANDCTLFMGTVTVTVATGIEEPRARASFSLYPNPVADKLVISGSSGAVVKSILIFGADGRIAGRTDTPALIGSGKYRVTIGEMDPGLYYVQMMSDQGVEVLPFIKL